MPTMSVAPVPSVRAKLPSSAEASSGSKLPIVEPGKKPAFGASLRSSGRGKGLVKSAATGSTRRRGKSRPSSSASLRRNSSETSTGT